MPQDDSIGIGTPGKPGPFTGGATHADDGVSPSGAEVMGGPLDGLLTMLGVGT